MTENPNPAPYTPKRRRAADASPEIPVTAPAAAAEAKADAPAGDAVPARKRRSRSGTGGHSLKLSAPTRAGETRRWFNDDGNRIAEARELGYEFVSEPGIQTDAPGARISRLVGTKANGEPLHAYLMETPDELHAQGVAEKEAHARQIDEAIRSGRDSTGRLSPEESYGHGSIKVGR